MTTRIGQVDGFLNKKRGLRRVSLYGRSSRFAVLTVLDQDFGGAVRIAPWWGSIAGGG